jgi:hypothetical protein
MAGYARVLNMKPYEVLVVNRLRLLRADAGAW